MSRLVSSLARSLTSKAKISEAVNASQQSCPRPPSSDQLVVRVDPRTPSLSSGELCTDSRPSGEVCDVAVCGERFGLSDEDLDCISDRMNAALERFEKITNSEQSSESFDAFMNDVEGRISELYEDYVTLIHNAAFIQDGRGQVEFEDLEMQV